MDVDDFVTVSGRWELLSPQPPEDWSKALEAFLLDLAQALERAGCSMIGHVKGMLDSGCGSPFFFSLTSFAGPARFRGGLPAEGKAQVMSLNVIIAGLDRDGTHLMIEEIIREHFAMRRGRPARTRLLNPPAP